MLGESKLVTVGTIQIENLKDSTHEFSVIDIEIEGRVPANAKKTLKYKYSDFTKP